MGTAEARAPAVGDAHPSTSGRRIRGLDAGERQAQRRRQLLDTALELFAAKGYANTSIEQICQTAFVGTKSFYELFDGKEACYLALLDELTERIVERMVAALEDAPDDETQASRALVGAFAHAVVDDPRVARATFGQASGISAAVDERRRANRRWAATFVESVWARYGLAARAGTSLHHVAIGVVGGLFDLVIDWLHDASDEVTDLDSLTDHLVDFYESIRLGLTSRS